MAVGLTKAVIPTSTPAGPLLPASAPISVGDKEARVCASKSSVTVGTPTGEKPAPSAGLPSVAQFVKCRSGVAAIGATRQGSAETLFASSAGFAATQSAFVA